MIDETAIGERYRALEGEADERQRRVWAAAQARVAFRGGIVVAARAMGMAETTIRRGAYGSLRRRQLPAKVTVSDAELEGVILHGHAFHSDRNDTGDPRVITRRRLTLYAEGAVSARACGAVATGCFARLLSYEVDCTPRSEVLGQTLSATAT